MLILLSNWTKMLILLCSVATVAVTVLVVFCIVSPFCLLHRLLPEKARIKYSPIDKQLKRRKGSEEAEIGEPVELTKLAPVSAYYGYGSPLSPYNGAMDSGKATCLPDSKSPPPTMIYGHRRVYTADSTYSSMTATSDGASRPTSPTASSVTEDADSIGSPPSVNSSEAPSMYGSLSVGLQYTLPETSSIGRLSITIHDAHELPGREYFPSACDPYVKVALLKTRTRLRRNRPHYVTLSEFQTRTVRKTRHPNFDQSFVVELPKSDLKECALKFMVFDRDKFANSSEIGESLVPLTDLHLKDRVEPMSLLLELQEPKQNNGELLLGISYLPTSERLSFNVIRGVNLKYENVSTNIDSLNLEVRILLVHNGKVVKKKKTAPVASTNNPQFNHAIAFDVPNSELQHITFLVGVANRTGDMASESDGDCCSSLERISRNNDRFIGKVLLGSNVRNTGTHHWHAMLQCPRQQVVAWHVLR